MKTPPPLTDKTPSYQAHRRQFVGQVLAPVLLAAALGIAMAVLTGMAAFGGGGEVGRWAAIATIWLALPVMVFGLLFLLILAGLIFLLARLLKITPTYTQRAQKFAQRLSRGARRGADAAVKPALWLEGARAAIKALFKKT